MENSLIQSLSIIKNKKLLAIYPHPDDETMFAGGLLCCAKSLGYKTTVCILTKGEAGQMHIHPHGKTIKQIRSEELGCACADLGVDEIFIGDFDDGRLKDQTPQLSDYVVKLIKIQKPSVIVTYDNTGITGHPDHITVSAEVKKILRKNFPEIILLWSTLPSGLRGYFGKPGLTKNAPTPTYKVSLSWRDLWIKKLSAARRYRSQRFGKTIFTPFITILLLLLKFREEWYHKVDLNKKYKFKFVKFDI